MSLEGVGSEPPPRPEPLSDTAPPSLEISEHVRRRMAGTRSRDTRPELALRRILHRRGLRYRVNYRALPGVRRTVDVAFIRAKVAVFVDGCFWHACPLHYCEPKTRTEWWRAKIAGNVARDADTSRRFEMAGWTVLRVWEHEDPHEAAERIAQVLARES